MRNLKTLLSQIDKSTWTFQHLPESGAHQRICEGDARCAECDGYGILVGSKNGMSAKLTCHACLGSGNRNLLK